MNKIAPYAAIVLSLGLTGCTVAAPAYEVEPIPGSIIYNGQPSTKLTKSPIGSTFSHEFRIDSSTKAIETYRIAPDRSLQLINRRIVRDWPMFGRDD